MRGKQYSPQRSYWCSYSTKRSQKIHISSSAVHSFLYCGFSVVGYSTPWQPRNTLDSRRSSWTTNLENIVIDAYGVCIVSSLFVFTVITTLGCVSLSMFKHNNWILSKKTLTLSFQEKDAIWVSSIVTLLPSSILDYWKYLQGGLLPAKPTASKAVKRSQGTHRSDIDPGYCVIIDEMNWIR